MIAHTQDVLVVVVRASRAVLVGVTAHDDVRIGVALGMRRPTAIDEIVLRLRRNDAVQRYVKVSRRGIFHANGNLDAARDQAMLLIFDRTRAHGNIAQQVVEVLVVLRVEHLVSADEARFGHGAHMQLAHGDDASEGVGLASGVGLMHQALVALARGAWLVGVDARNDHYLVFDLFLHRDKAAHVIHHAVLVVGGARADDQHDTGVLARENALKLGAALADGFSHFVGKRIHLLSFHGDGQLTVKDHIHNGLFLSCSVIGISHFGITTYEKTACTHKIARPLQSVRVRRKCATSSPRTSLRKRRAGRARILSYTYAKRKAGNEENDAGIP